MSSRELFYASCSSLLTKPMANQHMDHQNRLKLQFPHDVDM